MTYKAYINIYIRCVAFESKNMKQALYGFLALTILSCSEQKPEMEFESACDSTSIQQTTYKGLPATGYICYTDGEIKEWTRKSDSLKASYSELKLNQFFTEKVEIDKSVKEVGSVVFIERAGKQQRNQNFNEKYVDGKLIKTESIFLTVDEIEGQFTVCLFDQEPDSIRVYLTDQFPNVFCLGRDNQQVPVSNPESGKFCFTFDPHNFDKGYIMEFIQAPNPDDSTEMGTMVIPRYFDQTLLKRIKKRHTITKHSFYR